MLKRITLDAKEFAGAVSWAAKWIDSRAAMPVQRGLMLEGTSDTTLTISAYSENATARAVVDLEPVVGEDASGRAVVSGRLLAELCGALGSVRTVTLHSEGDAVVLTAGKFVATLPAMPDEDYPALPGELPALGTAVGDDLAAAVGRVAIAAKRDGDSAGDLAWSAMAFVFGESLELGATDRSRCAMTGIGWTSAMEPGSYLLTTPIATVLLDAAGSFAGPGPVRIGSDGRLLSLTTPTRSLTVRTISIDGDGYPINALRTYFAAPTTHTLVMDATAAVLPLKRAKIVTGKGRVIQITIRPGEMWFGATETEGGGKSGDVIDIDGYDGEEFVVGLDPVLFGEALATASGTKVQIDFTLNPRKGLILSCADEPNWRHLLMPRALI